MANTERINNIVIENAQIRFRNFSGKPGKYNAEGKRNFCVLLDDDIVGPLKADGWNVKYLNPREEGDLPQAYLQVSVNYDNVPPKIYLITTNGKTLLDEDSVDILDWAEIENVDLIVRPYIWEVNDKTGVKAYCKSMYVSIVQDEFDKKYSDVPDSAMNSIGSFNAMNLPFDED